MIVNFIMNLINPDANFHIRYIAKSINNIFIYLICLNNIRNISKRTSINFIYFRYTK